MKTKTTVKKDSKQMEHQKPEVQNTDTENIQLKNQLVRALADYDNLIKRTETEKMTWIKFSTQKLIQDLLPVLDTFENAQKHTKDPGLDIAINQFKEVLKNEGLTEIRPNVGEAFDENLHEVIDVVEGVEDGKIAEVTASGWKFMDPSTSLGASGLVVRHAKVKVTRSEKAS